MAKKFDGVVEAVRYTPDGLISTARVYERRGPTFSDRVLIDRDLLLQRIKAGKRYITGERKPLLASTFEVGKALRVCKVDGKEYLATGDGTDQRDHLDGVPLF